MKRLIRFLALLLLIILFDSCDKEKDLPNPSNEKGTLDLSFTDVAADNNGRIAGASEPAAIYITIKDSEGNSIYGLKRFTLVKVGEDYVTESIEFEEGNYSIEEFIVVDDIDAAIYLTPKEGSEFDELVSDPLPVFFTISSEETSNVILDVLPTNYGEASQFGYATFSFNVVGVDYSVLLNNLEYPKALFWTEGNLYYTETAARNTSYGGKLTLNDYNLLTNNLTVLKESPQNSDALVVVDNYIYLSSYYGSIPGESGKVSTFNLSSNSESHLLDIEIATEGMCLDENDNIYLLGSSDNSNAKSLYKFPNQDYTNPEVLLTGLGRTWTITYHNGLIYFSDHNYIYSYNQIDEPVSLISKGGILGMAVTDNYIYYSEYFNNKVGRINLTTKQDELLFDDIIRPGAMAIDRINNILYLITNGTNDNQFKDCQLIRIGQVD